MRLSLRLRLLWYLCRGHRVWFPKRTLILRQSHYLRSFPASDTCRPRAVFGIDAYASDAGMTIRMLTPACAESKRLIDWVETGATLHLSSTFSTVSKPLNRQPGGTTPCVRALISDVRMDAGVHDALEKRYIKVRRWEGPFRDDPFRRVKAAGDSRLSARQYFCAVSLPCTSLCPRD